MRYEEKQEIQCKGISNNKIAREVVLEREKTAEFHVWLAQNDIPLIPTINYKEVS